jgi:hypothetical protein
MPFSSSLAGVEGGVLAFMARLSLDNLKRFF